MRKRKAKKPPPDYRNFKSRSTKHKETPEEKERKAALKEYRKKNKKQWYQ